MFNIIPSDVANRLKQVSDQAAAPAVPISKLKDALADLIPGQRLIAQIQAMLPNGTYRAIVGQREIVLALPHTAKAGDTLELEVVENEGRTTFALIGDSGKGNSGTALRESVATSLSRTGQLIRDLLSPPGREGQKSPSLVLNGNQPILAAGVPPNGAEIAPLLKDLITQSGMFYESHQAAWAEGKLPTSRLILEPQGQFSTPDTVRTAQADSEANPFQTALQTPVSLDQPEQHTENPSPETALARFSPSPSTPAQAHIPESLTPIVQQQLESLANQHYGWEGMAWPGQKMEWEIVDQDPENRRVFDEDAYRWQTRLSLQLPNLGKVSATLRLRGENKIDLQIETGSDASEIELALGGPALNQQMEDAGLYLATFGVTRHQTNPPDTHEESDT